MLIRGALDLEKKKIFHFVSRTGRVKRALCVFSTKNLTKCSRSDRKLSETRSKISNEALSEHRKNPRSVVLKKKKEIPRLIRNTLYTNQAYYS